MNEIGWYFSGSTALTGAYVKKEFLFKAKHLKIKTDNTVTISFDGVNDHGNLLAADGLVDFADVGKSAIYIKGTGNVFITAWDGN